MRRRWGARLCVLVALGCGGTGDDGPMKCAALYAHVCARALACLQDGTTAEQCATQYDVTACSQVHGVGPTYDACLTAIDRLSCSAFAPGGKADLPSTPCEQAFPVEGGRLR